jgi:hypothetical protein
MIFKRGSSAKKIHFKVNNDWVKEYLIAPNEQIPFTIGLSVYKQFINNKNLLVGQEYTIAELCDLLSVQKTFAKKFNQILESNDSINFGDFKATKVSKGVYSFM